MYSNNAAEELGRREEIFGKRIPGRQQGTVIVIDHFASRDFGFPLKS
jgi:hypothetical protein